MRHGELPPQLIDLSHQPLVAPVRFGARIGETPAREPVQGMHRRPWHRHGPAQPAAHGGRVHVQHLTGALGADLVNEQA
ncbi:hypothetical protein [Hydrogenophaga intermedia]|uniref:hypothetical protein n=1 Tax=Hydrogenophaga intermedia TaxID=65786 RepID=UPI00204467B3|nr:hypothetical protein [Hydrogenophaga intermedia]MCM3565917.1 hypothetical protein [Hydrogenophaga intermedia]